MSIHIHAVATKDFRAWCDEHGIDIHVHERGHDDWSYTSCRYWGDLRRGPQHIEIMRGGFLSSPCSSADTVDGVVAQMARDYSEQRIAIGAYSKEREEIQCPRFTVKP